MGKNSFSSDLLRPYTYGCLHRATISIFCNVQCEVIYCSYRRNFAVIEV
jgi:hypothetical protein